MSEIKDDLSGAYRGNADGSLKQAIDSTYASLFSALDAYLAASKAGATDAGAAVSVVDGGNAASVGNDSQSRLYEAVVNSADNGPSRSLNSTGSCSRASNGCSQGCVLASL